MSDVIVLGAGYAGLGAVRELARLGREHQLILVDRLPYHQLITQLPAVAAGRVSPSRAAIPLKRIVPSRARILHTEILSIAPMTGEVVTTSGRLIADRLVIAIGMTASDLGVPGALKHAVPLKSVRDAVKINEIMRRFRASRALTRIVIVGGGYTGTELAGEITDAANVRRGAGTLTVTIVQPDPRLLPQGNPRLAQTVERILRRRGVEMIFNAPLSRVEADGVVLRTGMSLPADIVVWAARTRPPTFVRETFDLTSDGRIPVDRFLRSNQYSRAYVAGDLANALDPRSGKPFPASAQMAVPEGERAGSNIVAEIEGRRLTEFRERLLGEALALGGRDGAADISGIVSAGRIALAVKRAALLRYLNRVGPAELLRDYL